MKKWLVVFALVGFIATVGVYAYIVWNEDVPVSIEGSEAEAQMWAKNIEKAVNKIAYDSTRYFEWTFGKNNYFWDQQNAMVEVKWENHTVLLNTKDQSGKSYTDGQLNADTKLLEKAWSKFCNDQFWLNAPTKLNDPGVELHLCKVADGRKGLKVSYTSGGVTPGDVYVWLVDENYMPTSYKMWTSIIPVGGVEVEWLDWQSVSTGALIAQDRKMGDRSIPVSAIKAGQQLSLFDRTEDPFLVLK